jgi:hypothetical protein
MIQNRYFTDAEENPPSSYRYIDSFPSLQRITECTKKVEEIMMTESEVKVNSIMKMDMEKLQENQEEMKEEEIIPATLEEFLMMNE